jgi:tetratricopeptide (TPR) repeat protein
MNRNILIVFITLSILALVAVTYYKHMTTETVSGENRNRLANKYLEDGKLEEALKVFDEAISINPSFPANYFGKAITFMQLGQLDQARTQFDKALALDDKYALAYANRGILNDRTGRYPEAVKDYRKALEINPKLTKGPGWLWKFLRNIHYDTPSIAERADYIEKELKKPEKERLLRVPELDVQQRMYKR